MSPQSDAEWEHVVECLPQLAWVAYPDGATQCVNRLCLEYTGLDGEAFQGWDWLAVVHEDDVATARDAWAKAVEGGKVLDTEMRFRRFDGVYRWHAVRSSPMHNNSGEIERWLGTVTDIESARSLERSLVGAVASPAEVDPVMTALRAAAPVAMGFVNSEFRITHANDELAGIDADAAPARIGKRIAEALPTLWPQIESACVRVIESKAAVGNVTVVGGAVGDDQVHQWLVSCYAVEANDEIIGVGIVAVDVTELSQTTEFRSAILSRVADGVIAADADGRVYYMNVAASTILGWTSAEATGRFLNELITQSDGAAVDAFAAPYAFSSAHSGPGLGVRNDGSTVPVAYSTVLLGLGAVADRAVVVFRELSEPPATSARIRLLIIDRHPVVTEAFALLLASDDEIELVGTASSSAEGIAAANRLLPDVVLVDADLPDDDGISTASRIGDEAPNAYVILVVAVYDAVVVAAAIEAGCGWVLDRTDGFRTVVSTVKSAYAGETVLSKRELDGVLSPTPVRRREATDYLTPREREVLSLIAEGLSNRAIAKQLAMAENTVRNHVQRILFKLNVHSKLEAIVFTRSQSAAQPQRATEGATETAIQYTVHQASGMVAAQLDVSVTHALNTISAYAGRNGRPVAAVAEDVIARRLRFGEPLTQ